MAFWSGLIGGGIKEASEGVSNVANSAGNLAVRIRTAWTGEPDPDKKAEMDAIADELDAMRDKGQHALSVIEAKSGSFFIAGWRPAIGWVCALSLFMYFPFGYLVELVVWVAQCEILFSIAMELGKVSEFVMPIKPTMDIGEILGLVASLLGMAGMRSYEKNKGVAR